MIVTTSLCKYFGRATSLIMTATGQENMYIDPSLRNFSIKYLFFPVDLVFIFRQPKIKSIPTSTLKKNTTTPGGSSY